MNDEKQDDVPVSDNDQQIIDYLDEMLHDPAAGQPVSVQPELSLVVPDNVAQFDISKKKTANSSMVPAPNSRPAVAPHRLTEKKPDNKPNSKPGIKDTKTLSLIDRPTLLTESLLRMPAELEPQAPAPVPQAEVEGATSKPAQPPQQEQARKSKPEPEPAQEVAPQVPIEPQPQPEPQAAAVSDAEQISLPGLHQESRNQWCENGRPEWAQSRFECLIFTVNGLKLAVPLVLLGSIHQIDRKFNALPGQYDWFIGILQTPNAGNIKVLDTGLCVMPERNDPAARESLAYVITIHGYSWGLACHQVEKSITLEPDQVKWRTQRGKRPWLAGTVLDYMCSLVDTDGFQDIINQAELSQ